MIAINIEKAKSAREKLEQEKKEREDILRQALESKVEFERDLSLRTNFIRMK